MGRARQSEARTQRDEHHVRTYRSGLRQTDRLELAACRTRSEELLMSRVCQGVWPSSHSRAMAGRPEEDSVIRGLSIRHVALDDKADHIMVVSERRLSGI